MQTKKSFSLFIVAVLILVSLTFSSARPVNAQSYFGGLRVLTMVCTCSANFLIYVLDYATNRVLALVYQPGASLLYSFYNIYGTYLLGSYTPGAGQCQMYVGTSCTQINSDGMLNALPGTGTSQ